MIRFPKEYVWYDAIEDQLHVSMVGPQNILKYFEHTKIYYIGVL